MRSRRRLRLGRGGQDYDVIVIGGGSGGITAAREAVRRGASTLLVEAGRIGGDCTFTGCVPSKALLAAAARGQSFTEAMTEVHRAIEAVAATEQDDVLRREGIEVRHGWASFRSPTELDVDGWRTTAQAFVIATGSAPTRPPVPGLDAVDILTNENLFQLDRLPARLAVLGGGPIGAEMGQAFARLGAAVTLIESGDRLLSREEPEASEVVTAALVRDGVDVRLGAKVVRADSGPSSVMTLESGVRIEADRILVATGRRAPTDELRLGEAGVDIDERGFIKTDDALATTTPGIWAVGDVAGRMQFTHAAARMAMVAVHNAMAPSALLRRRFDPAQVPWATFTAPEVGRVGMTERESAAHGGRVAYLPMSEVDRAVAVGETEGFIKLIAGPRFLLGNAAGGRLLGATVVAPVGGELVHEVALAMRTRSFTGRLAQTVHAYPTWSMGIQKAAAQFFYEVEGREARPAVA